MRTILILVVLLLSWGSAEAAYTTATIHEVQGNRVVVRFEGDAGEPPQLKDFTIGGALNLRTILGWKDSVLRELNNVRTLLATPELQVGAVLPNITIVDVDVDPKVTSWRKKAAALTQLRELGATTGQLNAEIKKLEQEVDDEFGNLTANEKARAIRIP